MGESASGVVRIDEHGSICSADGDTEDLIGIQPHNLTGSKLIELLPELIRAPFEAGLGQLRATGETWLAGQQLTFDIASAAGGPSRGCSPDRD